MLRTEEQGPCVLTEACALSGSFGVTDGASCFEGSKRFSASLTLLIAIELNLQIEFVRKIGTN